MAKKCSIVEEISYDKVSGVDRLVGKMENIISDHPYLTTITSGFMIGAASRSINVELAPAMPHFLIYINGGFSKESLPGDLAYGVGVAVANTDRLINYFTNS